MTNKGEISYVLGMEIHQDHKGIFICQRKYANEVLVKFDMKNNKPICTPLVHNEKLIVEDGTNKIDGSVYRSLIGCLLYLIAIRFDVMFTASLLSRFMQNPSEKRLYRRPILSGLFVLLDFRPVYIKVRVWASNLFYCVVYFFYQFF